LRAKGKSTSAMLDVMAESLGIVTGIGFEAQRCQPYMRAMKRDSQPPPFVREIVYGEPFGRALRLRGQRALSLFESAQRHEQLGRYSFLAVNPSRSFVVPLGDANTLDAIAAFLAARKRPHIEELPPFQGGLAGFVSYDFGRRLEPKARVSSPTGLAPDLVLHAYDTVIATDHLQERSWIISDSESAADELETLLRTKPAATGPITCDTFQSNFARADYEAAVKRVVDYILAGDIFQTNLTQCLSAAVPDGFDIYGFYRSLCARNPAPFQALLDYDGIQVMSSSPERLVSFDGRIAEARPIKGTRKRDADPARDAALAAELQASRKDRAENVMIVDLLRNDLSRVAKPGTVQVPQLCGLETYANVHHLVSSVTAELRDGLTQVDLFRAVFPGGSITGAPKIRAMEIIDELEGQGRGVYCGAIGYFGYDGACDFNIAIRTVQVSGGVASVQGGGGITARSEPAAEYDESKVKIARLLEAFG
jgi:para-aminobenzoate synthetase component I